MIYFDSAATTIKKPQQVIDAVVLSMSELGNAGRGAYGFSLDASKALLDTREKVSRFFNISSPLNVIFTKNATESLNLVIKGLLTKEDGVIITPFEHNSVLRPLYLLEDKGLNIKFMESDSKGNLNYDNLDKLLLKNTKAVICNHGSNVIGNIINIKKISNFCKKNNLIFILDASQTAGIIPINMKEMGIDILCFTGHKSLLAMQGTGGICFNGNFKIKPLISGGTGSNSFDRYQPESYPDVFEAGTVNAHGIAGLNAAIDYINEKGIVNLYNTEMKLMNRFYEGIKNIENIKTYGDFEKERVAIVSLTINGFDSTDVSDELFNEFNIATRSGYHCAPLLHNFFKTNKIGQTRFSFSSFNTLEEVDIGIKAIKKISQS